MVVEVKNFIREKLENMFLQLPIEDRLDVIIPDSIENFKLVHPVGAILISYQRSDFKEAGLNYDVSQYRDVTLTLFVIARKKKLYPEQYVDLIIDELFGVEVEAKRADRFIKVIKDEFVDETNGVWTYAIDILIPMDFFK